MLDRDVAYLLVQCRDNRIEATADAHGGIVLDDTRDEHSFRQLAGSLGWRSAGFAIERNGRTVDVSAKQREPAQRRTGYRVFTR